MIRVLAGVAVLAVTIYAVVECIQTSDDSVRNLPKLAWVFIILLFPPIGAIAWLIAGRPTSIAPPQWGSWNSKQQGPRGPDDDPDFLRKL